MAEHRDIGIAGPRLEQPDGSFDHASRRSFPTVLGALGHFSGVGRGEATRPNGPTSSAFRVLISASERAGTL
jgi:hypothetical protein